MGDISISKFFDINAVYRNDKKDKMTLLVGEYAHVKGADTLISAPSSTFYLDFKDLSAEVLRALNPDLIISPVMGSTFDCLELAEFLEQAAFSGRYRVVLENIPRPNIICHEVRHKHPTLDFNVISAKPKPSKRLN